MTNREAAASFTDRRLAGDLKLNRWLNAPPYQPSRASVRWLRALEREAEKRGLERINKLVEEFDGYEIVL